MTAITNFEQCLDLTSPDPRLRRLWQMTAVQRVAAMRRGKLSYRELAAWSGRYPHQVPTVNGEFEWLAAFTPEACE